MINLIGILILIIIEAILFSSVVLFFNHKLDLKDNEISERDALLGERTQTIKEKNILLDLKQKQIKELEDEIRRLKRENNKRLRQDN